MKVEVQLMKLDTPSINGRVYSKETMEEVVKNFNESQIKGGTLGKVEEMTHPIDLKDLSHVFENVRIEDDKVMATMNILDTPKGQNVKALLESNVKLALAPRLMIDEQQKINEDGQPILDENGKPIIETKVVNLISCDIVLDKEKAFEGNTIEIE